MKHVLYSSSLIALFATASCQHSMPNYLTSQGLQQGSLFIHARPIPEVMHDPLTDPVTKKYLQLSQEVIKYASLNFKMKTGRNYTHFVQLKEPYVTHVVVAAEPDKLEAHLFKYPIFGSLPYRGYFKKSDALEFAETLKLQGLDVYVRPVSAYSSTGWLPDPVLSSMMRSRVELIEVLFHELVHLQFYLPNQADFNEAFATWFAEKATYEFIKESSLADAPKAELMKNYQEQLAFDQIKFKKSLQAIDLAEAFYKNPQFKNLSQKEKMMARQNLFSQIKALFATDPRMQKWAEIEWNNALLVSLGTYYGLVSSIDKLAQKENLDFKELLARTVEDPKAIQLSLEKMLDEGCSHSSSPKNSSPAQRRRSNREYFRCPEMTAHSAQAPHL